jgi:hypothetical protein
MFVENNRLDSMIGGQVQSGIPYPKIFMLTQRWHAKASALAMISAELEDYF